MNALPQTNGPRSEDPTGNQACQETERAINLQLQARKTDGSFTREKRDYIVHIENASDFRAAFIVQKVGTAQELFEGICDRHPKLCHPSIAMRVSDSRTGSLNRVFYEQQLPQHTDSLYVQLVLRKHTPICVSKIEKQ